MHFDPTLLIFLTTFGFIALSSKQIGDFFARFKFPLITGFIFAGILAGPYAMNLISRETTSHLRFISEISLAFIAFAAGGELYLKELRDRLKSIQWITVGLVVSALCIGTVTTYYLADMIPFMQGRSVSVKIALAILAGAILVARSPSSAIAIVNELRARGTFTQIVLGVTVISDVAVIVLFAVSSSIADVVLTNAGINISFFVSLLVAFVLTWGMASVLGHAMKILLSLRVHNGLKVISLLLLGYGVFYFSHAVRQYTYLTWHVEVLIEPLLICMAASFWISNFTSYRADLIKILNDVGPSIYIAFFTLAGAGLDLNIVLETWVVALILVGVRLLSIMIGAFAGGMIAGDPMKYNRWSWMAFVTQAGIGLALAEQVAVEFPSWGPSFAALIISVIIINQVIGPPLFKWVLFMMKEAHPKAEEIEFNENQSAIVFGFEGQSLALARQLKANQWAVKVVTMGAVEDKHDEKYMIEVVHVADLSETTLRELHVADFHTVVAMMSDDENYEICRLCYEKFGNSALVASLKERSNMDKFRQMDALIVDPSTAFISLLDHFVRAPYSASLFMGREANWDIMDVELKNPSLHGVFLRDLSLPLDALILSVRRGKQMLISRGHTRLQVGDWITVVGSLKSLEELTLKFESHP